MFHRIHRRILPLALALLLALSCVPVAYAADFPDVPKSHWAYSYIHDAVSRGNIPAGCGITDYTAVIGALKDVGYQGNLTVELEFTDNPRRYNRQALEHLRQCLAGTY